MFRASSCIWCGCLPHLEKEGESYVLACPKCLTYRTCRYDNESDVYEAWNDMQGKIALLWHYIRKERYDEISEDDKHLMGIE